MSIFYDLGRVGSALESYIFHSDGTDEHLEDIQKVLRDIESASDYIRSLLLK
ncbi:MAG: hypothetical protein Q7S27_03390 [Nanoarchaeota archaeon]|nr:hypothetical protein [Nanoarchaeota archaeon]